MLALSIKDYQPFFRVNLRKLYVRQAPGTKTSTVLEVILYIVLQICV